LLGAIAPGVIPLRRNTLDFIKRLAGIKRKPSTRAQLIALPNAVVIHTEEGNVIITPQLAKDIHENLPQITKQAEKYKKEEDKTKE
jgi:hypothetical protein